MLVSSWAGETEIAPEPEAKRDLAGESRGAIADVGLPTNNYMFVLASHPSDQQVPYQHYVVWESYWSGNKCKIC